MFDARKGVKSTTVAIGDMVVIKQPGLVGTFSKLIKVIKFRNAVKTQDSGIWEEWCCIKDLWSLAQPVTNVTRTQILDRLPVMCNYRQVLSVSSSQNETYILERLCS